LSYGRNTPGRRRGPAATLYNPAPPESRTFITSGLRRRFDRRAAATYTARCRAHKEGEACFASE